jgi:hypothetical protein
MLPRYDGFKAGNVTQITEQRPAFQAAIGFQLMTQVVEGNVAASAVASRPTWSRDLNHDWRTTSIEIGCATSMADVVGQLELP